MELISDKDCPGKDYRGKRVRKCTDGKYRWLYEMSLVTNPTVFLTVFGIFFWIIVGAWVVFGFFLYVVHGDWKGLLGMGEAMLLVLAIFAVLTMLGVLLLAAAYGGKYRVLFEMDEVGVKHIQLPADASKAKKMGLLAAFFGLATGKPAVAGAGLLAAGKDVSTSEFKKVRRVTARRRLHLIKVNQLLERNQVYASAEEFDFVFHYIKSHCVNAK